MNFKGSPSTATLFTPVNSENPSFRKVYSSRNGGHSLLAATMPYPGIDEVIERIRTYIETFRADQQIRDKTIQISKSVRRDPRTGFPNMRDFDAVAAKIYNWIVSEIEYIRDPNQVERLQSPEVTLKLRSGDCDDMVILGGAMLESVGIPTRMKLVGQERGKFSHIYLEYFANGEWKGFDPTVALHAGYSHPEEMFREKETVVVNRPQKPIQPPTIKNRRRRRGESHFVYE